MSYDGFYGDLSTRGTANEALDQITVLKDRVSILASEAEVSAINSEVSATTSGIKAAASVASAVSALSSKNAAETSEVNAGFSEEQAVNSATAAALSETNAAESATTATSAKDIALTQAAISSDAATIAVASETSAEQSAAVALASKNSATASATTATTKATEAATSATAAKTSETNAKASEVAVLPAITAGLRFCGVSATVPLTRLNGSPLQQADEYHNSVDKLRYSWTGTAWVALNSSAQQLEAKLVDATNPQSGAGTLGLYDPLSPAFLKVTSDILNFEPVHLFRAIPKTEWSKINARTSDYVATATVNNLLAAMRDQRKGKLVLPRGLLRVDGRIGLDFTEYTELEIEGEVGAEIRNMAYTATLVCQGTTGMLSKFKYKNFKVSMNNPDGYTGVIGPKSVFMRYCVDSVMEDIDETGAIGFGISMQNGVRGRGTRLYAKDHSGGLSGRTGTDGVHFTAMTGLKLEGCWGEGMADDCVSVGSFDPAWPTTDVDIINCGGKNSMGSAVKLYRMVDGVRIVRPWAYGTLVGGVSLYDDRSDSASTYSRYIRNVSVEGLVARDIKNTVGAYSRAPFNIYAQNGTQTSEFSNIKFTDSTAQNCIAGAVTKIDATATVADLEISRFTMKDQVVTAGLNPCILVQGVQGSLILHGNRGYNLAEGLISLDNQPAGFNNPFTGADISLKDNYARNYGQSLPTDPIIQQAAIFIRPSDKTMTVNMSGNEAYGRVIDFSTGSRAPFHFGGDVSPLSFIDSRSNNSDEKNSISMSFGGAGLDGARLNAAPTTGTWLLGWSVFNTLFVGTAGTVRKWECSVAGTFGTLSGITASGEANTNLVELNDASALYPGVFITIGSTKYRVLKVSGNQIRVDAKLSAAISTVAVQYTAPVFSALAA